MEIVDKRTKKEEHWQLGDVLEANSSISKGLIVKNDNGKYCLMDIDPSNEGNYSTMNYYGDAFETFAEFYDEKHCYWHKVNAKLVIE